jgi:NADPH:quinone reductase-like Zn-dependent oxidoreductase
MKAIVSTAYGAPEVLQDAKLGRPEPQEHEALIRVRATAVTAAHCAMRPVS